MKRYFPFLAAVIAAVLVRLLHPLPDGLDAAARDSHPLLAVVAHQSPALWHAVYWSSFVNPAVVVYAVITIVSSLLRVWFSAMQLRGRRGKLPPWPISDSDPGPSICVGELHHQIKLEEAPYPRWCVMPEKGLYTGLVIFGAIGTGKTSSCMNPFCRQLLGWRKHDKEKRAAALVLEVKGDFCYDVQEFLREYDRYEDYMEISLGDDVWQWNPLHAPWLDTYSLAYSLSSLVNQLFGKSKEPFWQQAYTNVIRWQIECFRSFPDPWFTFADIYRAMVDPAELDALILRQTKSVYDKYVFQVDVSEAHWEEHRERLSSITVTSADVEASRAEGADTRRKMSTYAVQGENATKTYEFDWRPNEACRSIVVNDVELGVLSWELNKPDALLPYAQHELESPADEEIALNKEIERWYRSDWLGLDQKLRSSIVVGMSVFLGIFVVPKIARVFCPKNPKDMNEEEKKRLLPPLADLIEEGKVLAMNMPAGENPALARAVGVMLKQSWLSTLLLRPKKMKLDKAAAKAEGRAPKFWRPAVFVCDEYQSFVTCGEDDPSGDEKMFALTRQSRCIPIVATQSIVSLRSVLGEGEAWRSLLQTLRSRIFLSLADDFSQKTASDLMGQVTRLRPSFSISENTGKAGASFLTGRVGGGSASAGLSKSYQERREPLFHPRDFAIQKTCQAIAQIFDGNEVRDATRVYLKAYYHPRELPYWRALERGMFG